MHCFLHGENSLEVFPTCFGIIEVLLKYYSKFLRLGVSHANLWMHTSTLRKTHLRREARSYFNTYSSSTVTWVLLKFACPKIKWLFMVYDPKRGPVKLWFGVWKISVNIDPWNSDTKSARFRGNLPAIIGWGHQQDEPCLPNNPDSNAGCGSWRRMFKHKSSSVEPWMKTNEVEHAPIYKIDIPLIILSWTRVAPFYKKFLMKC